MADTSPPGNPAERSNRLPRRMGHNRGDACRLINEVATRIQAMNYDDPKVEDQWCAGQRSEVETYLARENVVHGRIGEWPAWHLAPHVSIWAIESRVRPDSVGWWVISGDVPTDYISAAYIRHPRKAMLAFANRWRIASEYMLAGQEPPDFVTGEPSDWPRLAPMLARRAQSLHGMAADEAMWAEA